MPNTRSIESFPSEYLEFLKRAAIERVEVPLPSWREAFKVRVAIQSLRGLLRKRGHPLYETVAKTTLLIRSNPARNPILPYGGQIAGSGSVKGAAYEKLPDGSKRTMPENEEVFLVGEPRDSSVLSHFHAAGIQPETLEEDPLTALGKDL